MTTTSAPAPARDRGLLDPTYLPLVLAAFGLVTLGAYENRAVVTVLPVVVRELDGIQWFGLATGISSFTFLVATALAGVLADRIGPRRVIVTGATVFVAAQVVTATATSMGALLVGRGVSGIAEGLVDIGLVVLLADAMPEHLRAKVFATFSAAWVLPSLFGPFLAGVVAEAWGWRVAFASPLALLVVLLVPLARSLRLARPRQPHPWTPSDVAKVSAATVVALAVALLTWAAAALTTASLALPGTVAALALLAASARHALPAGTVRLRRGLPATVAIKLVVSGAFAGLGAYLPLMLVEVHGVGPRLAGISLAITGTLWAVGSFAVSHDAIQERTTPGGRVRAGLMLMGLGAVGPLLLATGHLGLVAGMLGWCVSALGMGVAYNTLSVHTVDITPDDLQGDANAAATLAAAIGVSLATAGGGGLVGAHADHLTGSPFAWIVGVAAAVALLGAALARRIEPA